MSWNEFTELLSNLVRYIKLHGGYFNTHTINVREGLHGLPRLNELSVNVQPRDIHSMN